MKTALVIRHVGFEDLGGFASPLASAGFDVRYVDAGEHDLTALAPDEDDLVVVLGGPIGVYEETAYPFLKHELGFVERRLATGRPIMGICLGAQFIARAAGARVYPSGGKEIGFGPIDLTEAGRQSCLAPFAAAPTTLHWHGDTFDLPSGAVRLASTDLCENQAFAIGANIIGFQFHPEATGQDIERWLIGHAVELATAGVDVLQVRRDATTYGDELTRKASDVVSAWLAQLEDVSSALRGE